MTCASASIPAAFPPVTFEVEANGQSYDELHVDGGTASQVFLYPAAIDWGAEGALLGSLLLVVGAMGGATALVHVRMHPWKGTPFDTQIWQLLVLEVWQRSFLDAPLPSPAQDTASLRVVPHPEAGT